MVPSKKRLQSQTLASPVPLPVKGPLTSKASETLALPPPHQEAPSCAPAGPREVVPRVLLLVDSKPKHLFPMTLPPFLQQGRTHDDVMDTGSHIVIRDFCREAPSVLAQGHCLRTTAALRKRLSFTEVGYHKTGPQIPPRGFPVMSPSIWVPALPHPHQVELEELIPT